MPPSTGGDACVVDFESSIFCHLRGNVPPSPGGNAYVVDFESSIFVTHMATSPHRPAAVLMLWTSSPPICNSRPVPHRPRGDTVFVAYVADFQHPFCFVAHVASPIAREAILLLIGCSPLSASFAPGYSWSSFPFTSSMARTLLPSGSCRCRARNLTNRQPSAVVTHSMPSAVYPNSCGSAPCTLSLSSSWSSFPAALLMARTLWPLGSSCGSAPHLLSSPPCLGCREGGFDCP